MTAFNKCCILGNRNEYSTKHDINFVTSTLRRLHSTSKTKNSTKTANRLLQYVLLNRLFQTFAACRSLFVSLIRSLEHFLAVFWQEIFLDSRGFYQKFTCDLSQLWRHQAIKYVNYMRWWGIHSCFHGTRVIKIDQEMREL